MNKYEQMTQQEWFEYCKKYIAILFTDQSKRFCEDTGADDKYDELQFSIFNSDPFSPLDQVLNWFAIMINCQPKDRADHLIEYYEEKLKELEEAQNKDTTESIAKDKTIYSNREKVFRSVLY